jgi:hypothetical protein
MTARKPAAHVNALERHARAIVQDGPAPVAPDWEEVAKAIRRAAQRAGLDRKRGGLERWHSRDGNREP